MAEFTRISMDVARQIALPPRQAIQEQYRHYVRQLTPESAGRLELGPEDRSITERARLKAAARAIGLGLDIQRQGDTLFFWVSEDGPQPSVRRGGRKHGSR